MRDPDDCSATPVGWLATLCGIRLVAAVTPQRVDFANPFQINLGHRNEGRRFTRGPKGRDRKCSASRFLGRLHSIQQLSSVFVPGTSDSRGECGKPLERALTRHSVHALYPLHRSCTVHLGPHCESIARQEPLFTSPAAGGGHGLQSCRRQTRRLYAGRTGPTHHS